MTWYYQGKEVNDLPQDCEAFVYIIYNHVNGKKYVGKKLAKFKKTRPPLRGRKNKRRSKVESDWRDYWGSSDNLLEDIAAMGVENFTREILYFCPSRGVASYLEMVEQVQRRVLETDEYYNGIINVRIGGSRLLKEALATIRSKVDPSSL